MHPIAARFTACLLRLAFAFVRALGPDRAPAFGGFLARNLGPLLPQQRIALTNLRLAFPDLDEPARRRIAREAWDNLGRVACEYVHLEQIYDFDPEHPSTGRIEASPEVVARTLALREAGKPALLFTAHLANWEVPALVPARHGIASAMLYRAPNNSIVAEEILRLRRSLMGALVPAGLTAPRRLSEALEEGKLVGMVVDQHFSRGPRIDFLGRPAHANPLIAQLARRHGCAVHGARAIRLPNGRFRLELTEALDLPRDAKGEVDVAAATQMINNVIAGWVREHPGQWLWMHRRWRG
jgi:KDO2-lipid IV(A) lauroyltransferase